MVSIIFSANALLYVGKFTLTSTPPGDDEPIRVSREQVVSVAEELCKLLQQEFIFAPVSKYLVEYFALSSNLGKKHSFVAIL